MQDRHNLQGRAISAIDNQVGGDWPKSNFAVRKVWACMSLSGPFRKLFERREQFIQHLLKSHLRGIGRGECVTAYFQDTAEIRFKRLPQQLSVMAQQVFGICSDTAATG